MTIAVLSAPQQVQATTIFHDDFTDTDGTAITAHNSNWTYTIGPAYIQNNTLYLGSYTSVYLRNLILTDQCASYDVQFPLGSGWIGTTIRYNPSVDSYYTSGVNNPEIGKFYMIKHVNGVGSFIVNYQPITLPSSGWHNYKMCAIGNQISAYLDNTNITTVTDSSVAQGYAAFGGGGNYFDNFVLTDGAETISPTLTPTDTPTPTPTATPTPTPAIVIAASPASQTVTVGTPFTVDVQVTSSGQAFNAAQANVTVSPNLLVNALANPSTGSCNFSYIQAPSASSNPVNLSFIGASMGSTSTNCTVYRLTLTPQTVGNGTISISGQKITSASTNQDIHTGGDQTFSYTIQAATPTPTLPGTSTLIIDDSDSGTGQNQWNYTVTGWQSCTGGTGNCSDSISPNLFNGSVSYDNQSGDKASLSFTGTQVTIYGLVAPTHGNGEVFLDGVDKGQIDFHSDTRTGNTQVWQSPVLPATSHTVEIRVTGDYIALDRAVITTTTVTPPTLHVAVNSYPLDTYLSLLSLTGTNDATITSMSIVNIADNTVVNATPTGTTWGPASVTLAVGQNQFGVSGKDANNNPSDTTTIAINRHKMADINGDSSIDLADLSLLAYDWGNPITNLHNSLSNMNTGSTTIDITDFSVLADNAGL